MLGRLARYLRVLGHDTLYVRGVDDDELRRRAAEGNRRLLTRDRRLADRTPGAVLLTSPEIGEQLRQLRRAAPEGPWEPSFDRCTLCNGSLRTAPAESAGLSRTPPVVYACAECGHRYWAGSHTAHLRAQLARWFATEAAP